MGLLNLFRYLDENRGRETFQGLLSQDQAAYNQQLAEQGMTAGQPIPTPYLQAGQLPPEWQPSNQLLMQGANLPGVAGSPALQQMISAKNAMALQNAQNLWNQGNMTAYQAGSLEQQRLQDKGLLDLREQEILNSLEQGRGLLGIQQQQANTQEAARKDQAAYWKGLLAKPTAAENKGLQDLLSQTLGKPSEDRRWIWNPATPNIPPRQEVIPGSATANKIQTTAEESGNLIDQIRTYKSYFAPEPGQARPSKGAAILAHKKILSTLGVMAQAGAMGKEELQTWGNSIPSPGSLGSMTTRRGVKVDQADALESWALNQLASTVEQHPNIVSPASISLARKRLEERTRLNKLVTGGR